MKQSHSVWERFWVYIQSRIKVEVNTLIQSLQLTYITMYWHMHAPSLSAELPLLEYYFRSDYSLNTLGRRWNKFQGFYPAPLGSWPIKSGKAVHVNGFLISLGCTREI